MLGYFHGGGFVLGSIESHDGVCRFLAEQAGVRVLSVGYRRAPEHPFPAAADDAIAAFRYVVEHAAEFGTELDQVAVGGDSAGANLAAAVAHAAARESSTIPALSLLMYPTTDVSGEHRSHDLFSQGYLLDQETLAWYRDQYLPDRTCDFDPRVAVLHDTQLSGLPPTCVFTAGFDPFRDEGAAYARMVRSSGATVHHHTFGGLLHGFANFVGADREARLAMHDIANSLRSALSAGKAPRKGRTHSRLGHTDKTIADKTIAA